MHFILNRRPCEVHNHRTLGQILEPLLFLRLVTRGHFYCDNLTAFDLTAGYSQGRLFASNSAVFASP